MINQSNIFDLSDIIINELIGDVKLTVIIGLILILYLTIKTKMPYQLSILFGILWLIIIFAETQLIIIWVFVVLFTGTLFYYGISKIMRRG